MANLLISLSAPNSMRVFALMLAVFFSCQHGRALSAPGTEIQWDTKLTEVAINGGADSLNPGTSCVKIDKVVHSSCTGGWVAIINNNRQLISAALMAKSQSSAVNFYYYFDQGSFHCPGMVHTPCSVLSIILR